MQLLLVPNAARPTGQQGNALAGNYNSDAKSLQFQCDANRELSMNKRKGSQTNPPWHADEGADQVTHPKPPNKILSS